MVAKQIKNNPAFLSEEELINNFVVRKTDLDIMIETIRENSTDANQHLLIVGPRGMGKTMLVLRIATEVRRDKELSSKWYPIVFGEESYEVTTIGELWLKGIFHLGEETGNERWKKAYKELLTERVEKRLYDRALSQLMEFAEEQGKRLLIVVENLNMLLGEQIKVEEGWMLRHTLINEPKIMMLGTSTTSFDEIENIDKPLFELFRVHRLKPLELEECREFWKSITGKSIEDKRMRPIQILTGGNPRLLAIIGFFAAGDTFSELMSNLTHLIDEYTSYFKSNIENLPSLERKVFVNLATIWEPATASVVAENARISVNKTSALLNRLVSRGSVIVINDKSRKKSYQIAERLYNIYYLIRRTGKPSDRVRAVVDFMVHYYEGRELVIKMASLGLEACCLSSEGGKDHIATYKEVINHVEKEEDRYLIIKSTAPEFFDLPDFDVNTLKQVELLKANKANKTALNDKEIKRIDLSIEETLRKKVEKNQAKPDVWAQLGWFLHNRTNNRKEAEKAYRTAINLDQNYGWVWAHLGQLLHEKLKRYPEAEDAYRKAIEIKPNYSWAWAQLGKFLHFEMRKYSEAEKAYRRAITLDPTQHTTWDRLALLLLEELKQYQEAEEAYRKAISLSPNNAWDWTGLGITLHKHLKRYSEAEEAYQKAIDIDPTYHPAWESYGELLYEKTSRYEEAEEAFQKAITFDPKCDTVWAQYGKFLHEKTNRYSEAEKAYRKAIELDSKNSWIWAQLGQLLHEKLKRYPEAEKAYRTAINLDQNYTWAWSQLGKLFWDGMERYSEAEEAFRKAISIKPQEHELWENLGTLLYSELKRNTEAEEAYRNAIKINPECSTVWLNLGNLLWEGMKRYSEAEEAYRKAISIKPNYAKAWFCLGCLFWEGMKRYSEAEEAFREAISFDPELHVAWEYLARLLHTNLERFSEAEAAYRKAIDLEPDCYTVWTFLGQLLHEKLGRYNEALEAYTKALKFKPDFDTALDLLVKLEIQRSRNLEEVFGNIREYFQKVGRTAENLNKVAWTIYESGIQGGLEFAEELAREAVGKEPNSPYINHTLASIIAKQNRWDEALNIAAKFLSSSKLGEVFPKDIVKFFSDAAVAGFAKESLLIIRKSECATFIEPLVVALQMMTGEEHKAPQEVVEIANDILKDIKKESF